MMSLWSWFATKVGDTTLNWNALSLWPWPSIVVGARRRFTTWQDYRAFTRLLKPGDFLLEQQAPYIGSNTAINGSLKHLAVYVGAVKGDYNAETGFIENPKYYGPVNVDKCPRDVFPRCIIHAISEGVVCADVGELLMESDYVVAVRPWTHESERAIILDTAFKHHGKPYDFAFDQTDDKRIFCTELGLHCVRKAAIIEPLSIKKRMGLFKKPVNVVVADYFTRYPVVCVSESCLDPAFQRQSPLGGAFQSAMKMGWQARIEKL